jgi:hypothetical protein
VAVFAVVYVTDGPRLVAFFAGYGLGATVAFFIARPLMARAARTMGAGDGR